MKIIRNQPLRGENSKEHPFAYPHLSSVVPAHDIHDEKVVRQAESRDLAIIDSNISLAGAGGLAARRRTFARVRMSVGLEE